MEGFCGWNHPKDIQGKLYLSSSTSQCWDTPVEFVYDPLSFKLGALFTFLGFIGCVVMTLVPWRKKPLTMH